MKMCKHLPHKVIDWIKEPRYHDDAVLISTSATPDNTEHYLIKFTQSSKYPEWFYMDRKSIVKSPVQKNGRGEVYAVPMARRQSFEPITNCEHEIK